MCWSRSTTAADAAAARAVGIPVLGYRISGRLVAATVESMSELVMDALINWPVR